MRHFHDHGVIEIPSEDHVTCADSMWKNILYIDTFAPLKNRVNQLSLYTFPLNILFGIVYKKFGNDLYSIHFIPQIPFLGLHYPITLSKSFEKKFSNAEISKNHRKYRFISHFVVHFTSILCEIDDVADWFCFNKRNIKKKKIRKFTSFCVDLFYSIWCIFCWF